MNDESARRMAEGGRIKTCFRCRTLLFVVHHFSFIFVFAAPVLAHEGEPHNFDELARAWSFEPGVVVALALSGWLYWRGVRRLWREPSSAAGRRLGVQRCEVWCYVGGWASLLVALVSPLHAWGRVLFSAHMTQHEVLMLVAAPLLVLGRPLVPMLRAMPVGWARTLGGVSKSGCWQAVWRVITKPLAAWVIHAVALWVWHVPVLFQAVLEHEWVHTAQHLSFFLSALLFWWALIHGRQGVLGYGAGVLYLFTTALHSGLLGALITFAGGVWYPAYEGLTASWGLTALEDQQLGGLIMWIPAGLVYVFAGLALFAGWMRESEARALRSERRRQAFAERVSGFDEGQGELEAR
ncbi:MAG TPA: cytochrome c oxidase assembly protein [Pyrinomonadaceae bacterium]|nr:cytochrome c oxidase assembly protein [Pyrinomonadaceae bacterium]